MNSIWKHQIIVKGECTVQVAIAVVWLRNWFRRWFKCSMGLIDCNCHVFWKLMVTNKFDCLDSNNYIKFWTYDFIQPREWFRLQWWMTTQKWVFRTIGDKAGAHFIGKSHAVFNRQTNKQTPNNKIRIINFFSRAIQFEWQQKPLLCAQH